MRKWLTYLISRTTDTSYSHDVDIEFVSEAAPILALGIAMALHYDEQHRYGTKRI